MATRKDNRNELVIYISRAIATRRPELHMMTYIPSMAPVEVFQVAKAAPISGRKMRRVIGTYLNLQVCTH